MSNDVQVQRVEITFVGAPPERQVQRASGVSGVEIAGSVLSCVVTGAFQPLLEAIRGHEVISLTSTPMASPEKEEPGR